MLVDGYGLIGKGMQGLGLLLAMSPALVGEFVGGLDEMVLPAAPTPFATLLPAELIELMESRRIVNF